MRVVLIEAGVALRGAYRRTGFVWTALVASRTNEVAAIDLIIRNAVSAAAPAAIAAIADVIAAIYFAGGNASVVLSAIISLVAGIAAAIDLVVRNAAVVPSAIKAIATIAATALDSARR